MNDENIDSPNRRRFLIRTAGTLGAVGAGLLAFPFLQTWRPSEKTLSQGATVECDLTHLAVDQHYVLPWQGKPIWVFKRSPEELNLLSRHNAQLSDPQSLHSQQPQYTQNMYRSRKPEICVLTGICTHLGCSPRYYPEKKTVDSQWEGGFLCPCHGSRFDLAGRVYAGFPAPTNLEIPPYYYANDNLLIIGQDGPG